jgi:hypothetical protein
MQVSEQTFQQADFELLRRILPYIKARIMLSSRTPARARKVPRLGFENCLTTSGVGKCGRLANVAGWLSNCRANKFPVDLVLPLHQMYQKQMCSLSGITSQCSHIVNADRPVAPSLPRQDYIRNIHLVRPVKPSACLISAFGTGSIFLANVTIAVKE